MGSQTPYEILGVSPGASKEQITRAFRKLAIKNHPDKGGDSEKYQAIRVAYDEIKNRKTPEPPKGEGNNLRISITVPLRDVAEGRVRAIRYVKKVSCKTCKRVDCRSCGGTGRDPVSLVMKPGKPCKKCSGSGHLRSPDGCRECGGAGFLEKKATVNIALHPQMGGPMVFKGEGNEREHRSGDLVVEVFVEKDRVYQASGLSLKRVLLLSAVQAIVGDEIILDVLGKEISFTIPAGTQNGQTIKKPGAGMAHGGRVGDLIVEASIRIPKILSMEELKLYTQILKVERESSCQNL